MVLTLIAQAAKNKALKNNLGYLARDQHKKNTTVVTNHFRLEVDPKMTFYKYQFLGSSESEKHAGKKRYMTTAIQQYLRQIDVRGLQGASTSDLTNLASFETILTENALNTIIAKCISTNSILQLNYHKFFVRNAYFDLATVAHSIAPLRGMRGYVYNVKQVMGSFPLNLCTATSTFWRPLLMALRGVRVYINYNRGSGDIARTSGVNEQHSRINIIRGFGKAYIIRDFELVGKVVRGVRPKIAFSSDASSQCWNSNKTYLIKPTWMVPEDLAILPDQIYAKVISDAVAAGFHNQSCRRATRLDGVSTSQFEQFIDEELPEIAAAAKLYADQSQQRDKQSNPIGKTDVPKFQLTAIIVETS
ncbi:hypothetical protein SVAN01_10737 [Stagonosporopsis vannaccii]|nr:hypothetical protein SVAN01_10737 [Stagonosporopsis vannaccii]